MNLSSKAESLFDALDSTIDYDHGTAYHAAVDDLIAYIAELEAERAWRPIETAPKGGYMFGRNKSNGVFIINGYDKNLWPDDIESPTHWYPLPEPPA